MSREGNTIIAEAGARLVSARAFYGANRFDASAVWTQVTDLSGADRRRAAAEPRGFRRRARAALSMLSWREPRGSQSRALMRRLETGRAVSTPALTLEFAVAAEMIARAAVGDPRPIAFAAAERDGGPGRWSLVWSTVDPRWSARAGALALDALAFALGEADDGWDGAVAAERLARDVSRPLLPPALAALRDAAQRRGAPVAVEHAPSPRLRIGAGANARRIDAPAARSGLLSASRGEVAEPRADVDRLLDALSPSVGGWRPPTMLIAGDRGVGRIADAVAGRLAAAGVTAGVVRRDGAAIAGEPVPGPRAAALEALARDPRVAAVVATASLRRIADAGLDIAAPDACVIAPRRLTGDAAAFNRGLARLVAEAPGPFILSAANAIGAAALRSVSPARLLLVSGRRDDPDVARHIEAGGMAARPIWRDGREQAEMVVDGRARLAGPLGPTAPTAPRERDDALIAIACLTLTGADQSA